MKHLIDKLEQEHILSKEEFIHLIEAFTTEDSTYLFEKSKKISQEVFGNRIFIRGLIEFTNFCKNDCYYCGIRKSNKEADRYRLTKEEILSCCSQGYQLGFRTFVLQGGEDMYFNDERMIDIISSIHKLYPDCAITLSIGEHSYESYRSFYLAGANRFLLRHETADLSHYELLHPKELSGIQRKQCLKNLKEIGYQVGTGFMVGSPYQTAEHLADDLMFLKELKPAMIGIGPFISHKDTPLANFSSGTLDLTLFFIGILRLMFPKALIPSTTALGTIHPNGREKGILAGANVVMPNLSPQKVRKKYSLYDNKICTGEEAAECIVCLTNRMKNIGYEIVVDRGDYKE